jgi:NADPH:quinone reductase-like Zn-dependent oxidoreductase
MKEDFTNRDEMYDVIFDIVGKSPYKRSLRLLKGNGYYLLANPKFNQLFRAIWTSRRSNKNVVTQFADESLEDLEFLKKLIEEGKIKAVIDRRYSLNEIVEAHRYVETGEKIGNVVIPIEHPE